MTKFTKQKQDEAILAEFLSYIRHLSVPELEKLFSGLFSAPELRMILTRFKIARELQAGKTYKKIAETLGVGENTVARVSTQLTLFGDALGKEATGTKAWAEKIIISWLSEAPDEVYQRIISAVQHSHTHLSTKKSRYIYGTHTKDK